MVKVNLPVFLGVPEITPVEALSASPEGIVPFVLLHVDAAPVALSVTLYASCSSAL